jgi:hypothetical protein
MRSLLFACAAMALVIAPAVAQPSVDPDAMEARMQASQAQAGAAAVHEGDDALTCDAIQAEMITTMNDPAVQQQMASMGAWAQGQQAQANGARAAIGQNMMAGMFTGFLSSFIPGAGYAQAMAQQAQANRQAQQAQQNMSEMTQMSAGMESIMPQMMRGQRLYELGQAKSCAFLQEPQQPPQ